MSAINFKDYPDVYAYAEACLVELKNNMINRQTIDINGLIEGLSEVYLKALHEHLAAISLTDGCFGGCKICYEGSTYGIRKQFSFASLENFAKNYLSSDVPYMNKATLVLNAGSDVLDYAEVDVSGKVVHDFTDVFKIFDMQGISVNYAHLTRLPGWTIPNFIDLIVKCLAELIPLIRSKTFNKEKYRANETLSTFRENTRLIVSLTEANQEMVVATVAEIYKKLRKRVQISEAAFLDIVQGDLVRRIGAGKLGQSILSDYGRRYRYVPFDHIHLDCKVSDGVKITPDGITSVANIYPAKQNPTGMLTLPFGDGEPYFKRVDLHTLERLIDGFGDNSLMIPSLPDSVSEPCNVLTPENIILREALRFRFLDNTLGTYSIEALMYAYRHARGGKDELTRQIEISKKLLQDNTSPSVDIRAIQTKVKALLRVFESYIPHLENEDLESLTNLYFYRIAMEQGDTETASLIKAGKLDFSNFNNSGIIMDLIRSERINPKLGAYYACNLNNQEEVMRKVLTTR